MNPEKIDDVTTLCEDKIWFIFRTEKLTKYFWVGNGTVGMTYTPHTSSSNGDEMTLILGESAEQNR